MTWRAQADGKLPHAPISNKCLGVICKPDALHLASHARRPMPNAIARVQVYATGLRSAFGLFISSTGAVAVTDNGGNTGFVRPLVCNVRCGWHCTRAAPPPPPPTCHRKQAPIGCPTAVRPWDPRHSLPPIARRGRSYAASTATFCRSSAQRSNRRTLSMPISRRCVPDPRMPLSDRGLRRA